MRATTFLLTLGLCAAVLLPGCAMMAGGAAGTAVLMAEDRRTPGTYLMDEEIELKAASRMREYSIEGVHASFTSYNRRLLITGQAPTAAIKAKVADIVRGVPNLRGIANEIEITAPTSLTARTGDSYTTAKVKTRILDDDRVAALNVKVVTENGVAYLMGIVTRAEAQAAAEVAARTSGVRRVVKVFEYMD